MKLGPTNDKKFEMKPHDDAEATKEKLVKVDEDNYVLLIPHSVITAAGGIMATGGGYVGYGIGHANAIPLGEEVGVGVEKNFNAYSDEIIDSILKKLNLDKIPGAQYLLSNETRELAHQAGEHARRQTIQAGATAGGYMGSIFAGGATIVALEGINLIYYFWQKNKEESRKRQAALEDANEQDVDQIISEFELVALRPEPEPVASSIELHPIVDIKPEAEILADQLVNELENIHVPKIPLNSSVKDDNAKDEKRKLAASL